MQQRATLMRASGSMHMEQQRRRQVQRMLMQSTEMQIRMQHTMSLLILALM